MLIQTHHQFAKYLFRHFKSHSFSGLLHKKSFYYGNIKPDLDFSLRNSDHTLEGAWLQIEKECKLLASTGLSKKDFSLRLGIISHFIADSFCQYHNQQRLIEKSFYHHFLYEMELHNLFLKALKKDKINFYRKVKPELSFSCQWLEYHEKYRGKSQKPMRDIRFALGVSITIMEQMLEARSNSLLLEDAAA